MGSPSTNGAAVGGRKEQDQGERGEQSEECQQHSSNAAAGNSRQPRATQLKPISHTKPELDRRARTLRALALRLLYAATADRFRPEYWLLRSFSAPILSNTRIVSGQPFTRNKSANSCNFPRRHREETTILFLML